METAIWGFLGAFIYAAPRFVACLVGCRDGMWWVCFAELLVALATGAIAAAAFSHTAQEWTNLREANAVAATLGLLANPLAPAIVQAASGTVGAAVSGRLGRMMKGGGGEP